jgi:prophage regulatory protein
MTTILRLPQVLAAVGMSRAWVYKAIRLEEFPAPVRLGKSSVGWLDIEVDAWLKSREKSIQPFAQRPECL